MSSSFINTNSDTFIVDTSKSIRQLYPNQFYKICAPLPSSSSSRGSSGNNNNNNNVGRRLGSSPVCGDGSQFCFYFSRPPQRALDGDRLIIELMGGGACWDADTCGQQADYLSLSDQLDDALGRSCQEVQAGLQQGDGGTAANMLCSGTLGSTDMTKYNTIIIPYCTQDVHIGDRTLTYNDGTTVHHHGAHNVMSVLQWVYRNFPRLQHAVVTGCSAGGTAVPVVQALLDKQYNHFGSRQLQTAVIADSPVYLTPTYFLEHALSRWNPQSILTKLGLPFQRFASSTEYPTRMWDFILRKGNNRDRWGFLSHTSDPISLLYYEYMSGAYAYDDDAAAAANGGVDDAVVDDAVVDDAVVDDDQGGNNNDDNNNRVLEQNYDYESQWYSELTESVSYIKNRHHNVQSYWIDSEGHCTFGLYYGLTEGGSDFEAFLSPIVKEDKIFVRPAVNSFLLSSVFGVGLILLLLFNRRRRIYLQHDDSSTLAGNDGVLVGSTINANHHVVPKITNFNSNLTVASTTTSSWWPNFKARALATLQTWESYPVTVGYTAGITLYFLCMISQQGFAHPMNNPSLGPNALGLSKFGILNPSLVVYQGQWFRLLTSNFIVSGVITYAVAIFYLFVRTRPLETKLGTDFKSPWLFMTLGVLVATFINFVYCFVPTRFGASCTSLAMLMGLQSCHLAIYRNAFVRPYLSIAALLFDLFVVSLIFPFNSWIMMTTGIFAGLIFSAASKRLDEFLPAGIKIKVGTFPSGKSLQSEIELFGQHSTEEEEQSTGYETMDDRRDSHVVINKQRKKRTKVAFCACLALLVAVVVPVIISVAASPRRLYEDSFYTGCKLFYSDQLDDLSSSFLSDDDNVNREQRENGGEGGEHRRSLESGHQRIFTTFLDAVAGIQSSRNSRRRTEGGENKDGNVDYSCAQFCVPHLISPLFQAIARNRGIPIQRGQCTENGYSTHVLDKTFSGFSYSLDVELYVSSGNNRGGDERM
jgi:membrane associated rhomboid family serine protease